MSEGKKEATPKDVIPKDCLRRLKKEYLDFMKGSNKNLDIAVDGDNLLKWYFIIKGLDGVYTGGYYLGIINFPKQYPMKAPTMEFITPNGRFNVHEKICTTFSHYHPETWSPSWTVESILVGLMSFMMEQDHGIGSIKRSDTERKTLAKDSVRFNKECAEFCKAFPDYEFE